MESDSMAMQGARKRGDPDPFESPDGKLAAEFAEDIPSTMHKPPPRKAGRWRATGSCSGNSNDAMTGDLGKPPDPSAVTGTSGNGNPSVVVTVSSESSEASATVKSLFTVEGNPAVDQPWAAEPIPNPPVLLTSRRPDLCLGPSQERPAKSYGKHVSAVVDKRATPPCEFFNVGSKSEDEDDWRTERRQMRAEFQAGKYQAEQEIAILHGKLAEVTAAAQEEHRKAEEARTFAESVRQQANLESERMRANAHDLASKMQNVSDAAMVIVSL
jgi:hypothetical protein